MMNYEGDNGVGIGGDGDVGVGGDGDVGVDSDAADAGNAWA